MRAGNKSIRALLLILTIYNDERMFAMLPSNERILRAFARRD
jgi:hypothetical protein